MTDAEKREAVRKFYNKWHEKGKENQDDRSYWIDFLQDVLGVENVTSRVEFQKTVVGPDGNTKFIDAYIPETRVLIEHKSLGIDLSKPQAGHNNMTPYQQAKMYDNSLPVSEKAKWIILSNFAEIWVYDMDVSVPKPEKFLLEQIPLIYNKFEFLVNKEQKQLSHEMEISIKAGEFVGLIYDALSKQYINPEDEESQKSLNILCVRLVFCLYAEDAKIFGESGHMFHDYLNGFPTEKMRKALKELFVMLNTPDEERDPYDPEDLRAFPYVNGGLFANEEIEIPNFTDEIREILLSKASDGFDWSDISPTIFGAVFESTLNPETRRRGGMHYTSIENIHKVIDPLFLDDLKTEYKEIKSISVINTRKTKLEAFQDKLASLTWLDPAAGSGNFLTETFLCIRELENQVIRGILDCKKGSVEGQIILDVTNPIKVSINQFYGIEINDFAVTVAKTALWIAESQMIKKTEDIVHRNIDFLPLKTNANIVEANALRISWESVVSKNYLNFIMGNPPFVGKKEQSKSQKDDMTSIFGKKNRGIGNLDYVSAWYKKTADFINGSNIKCALVSTNSITQGEQVPILWNGIANQIQIIFAYRTFRWDSEASQKAHVHCVIIGFCDACIKQDNKIIFDGESKYSVQNINPYLVDAPNILIDNHNRPISGVPEISYGSMPIDDGNLILNKEDVENLLSENADNSKFIRKYVGGDELLNNKDRWCLWLWGASPREIQASKIILDRINKTCQFRKSSNRPQTVALAETPMLFGEIRQPDTTMLVIPKVSSEKRRYIPISYVSPEIIVNGSSLIIPNAELYHFGVLISNVHMAWMRAVCGRMKSDYQYSGKIVYNNFPWCVPSAIQREKIEKTAQAILDARSLYPKSSLADLYDPLTMPVELLKAHKENDRAVMEAYGFDVKTMSEEDCVAELMKMYQELTKTEG